MPDSITIKDEPTPALSLEDQASLQEAEKSEEPSSELLAGKYKSVEDLEKGYKELQTKLSSGEKAEEPPTETEPKAETETESETETETETSTDPKEIYGDFIGSRFEEAGIDFGGMNERWQQTGKLTQEDYTALDGAGFNKEANIEPKLIGGKASRTTGDKFESHAQVVAAMNDPLYKTDPAFRKKVEQKLSRSSVF
jgi:hypothetical protein